MPDTDAKLTKKIAELRGVMAGILAPNPFRPGDIIRVREGHLHEPHGVPFVLGAGQLAIVLDCRWGEDLMIAHRRSATDSFFVATPAQHWNFELVERLITTEDVKPPVIDAIEVRPALACEGEPAPAPAQLADEAPIEVNQTPTPRRWWAKMTDLITNQHSNPTSD